MRKQISTSLVMAVLFMWSPSLSGQSAKLLKAERYLEAFRYEDALGVYHKLYRKDNNDIAAVTGLANCYSKAGRLEEAAAWYAKAVSLPDLDPETYFSYGQVLLSVKDCNTAQAIFDEYLLRKPYDERRSTIEDVCAYTANLQAGEHATSQATLLDFNGPDSDIAPAFFQDGIVFGSVRKDNEKKEAFYDLYFTSAKTEEKPGGLVFDFSPIQSFSEMINSEFNEAIIAFSPDEQEVYFTRNQEQAVSDKNPLHRLEIRVSRMGKDDSWSQPERLNINSNDFNTAHPTLSPDGNHLYFTSDRPGGFGGKDIYRCDRYGLSWGEPINLGPQINTTGDELYPSYHGDGILYFASNGHLGLGGLDVFRAEDNGRGLWSNITNLGVPVNSSSDDFGLIIEPGGAYGFFTSNREGGAGNDDIYIFKQQRILFQLQFTDTQSQALATAVPFTIKGQEYMNFSKEDGTWQTWLNPDDCLYLQVKDQRFETAELEICAASSADKRTLEVNWTMLRQAIDLPVYAEKGVGNVLYGTVYDELSGKPVSNVKLKLRSNDCGKFISLTSSEDGTFSYPFGDDCCYELTTVKEGYFASAYEMQICQHTKFPSEGLRVGMAPYRLQEGHNLSPQASVTEQFKVSSQVYDDATTAISYQLNIYYDLGRSSVRAEAIPELNRLYFLLLNNPDISLEVSSHTDSQGSGKLNRNLSQRRATAIVNWLASKGINRDRLLARGYGEERLVNKCEDGVDCSEEEHQLNRRTEFRVLEQEIGHSN